MNSGRRVGTLTTGIILVVFGIMFLMRIVFKNINYDIIISLWPVVFILLGIEVIASYVVNKQEKIRYDAWGIFLVIIMSFFSMAMAAVQIVIQNYPHTTTFFRYVIEFF